MQVFKIDDLIYKYFAQIQQNDLYFCEKSNKKSNR